MKKLKSIPEGTPMGDLDWREKKSKIFVPKAKLATSASKMSTAISSPPSAGGDRIILKESIMSIEQYNQAMAHLDQIANSFNILSLGISVSVGEWVVCFLPRNDRIEIIATKGDDISFIRLVDEVDEDGTVFRIEKQTGPSQDVLAGLKAISEILPARKEITRGRLRTRRGQKETILEEGRRANYIEALRDVLNSIATVRGTSSEKGIVEKASDKESPLERREEE